MTATPPAGQAPPPAASPEPPQELVSAPAHAASDGGLLGGVRTWLRVPTRRIATVAGLTVFAMFFPGLQDAGYHVPLAAQLAWLVASGLLVVGAFKPGLLPPRPAILHRPLLGTVAAALIAYVAILQFQVAFAALLWWAATVLFVRDAWRRGELGPVDPGRLTRRGGWGPRVVLGGAVLAAWSMSAAWLGEASVSWTSTNGDYVYYNRSEFPGYNLHSTGRAGLVALVILAVLVAAAWRPDHRHAARAALVPVAAGAILVPWGLWRLIEDQHHFNEMTSYRAGYMLAEGPWLMVAAGLVFLVGGLITRRRTRADAAITAAAGARLTGRPVAPP